MRERKAWLLSQNRAVCFVVLPALLVAWSPPALAQEDEAFIPGACVPLPFGDSNAAIEAEGDPKGNRIRSDEYANAIVEAWCVNPGGANSFIYVRVREKVDGQPVGAWKHAGKCMWPAGVNRLDLTPPPVVGVDMKTVNLVKLNYQSIDASGPKADGTVHQGTLSHWRFEYTHGGGVKGRQYDATGNPLGGEVTDPDLLTAGPENQNAVCAKDQTGCKSNNDLFICPSLILTLSRPAVASTSNAGMTTEAGEPSPSCAPIRSTLWSVYTAPKDQRITATTEGSTFDTVLAAYEGNWVYQAKGGTEVACHDDVNWPTDPTSKIVFNAKKGKTYYIQIAGYGWPDGGQFPQQGEGKLELRITAE